MDRAFDHDVVVAPHRFSRLLNPSISRDNCLALQSSALRGSSPRPSYDSQVHRNDAKGYIMGTFRHFFFARDKWSRAGSHRRRLIVFLKIIFEDCFHKDGFNVLPKTYFVQIETSRLGIERFWEWSLVQYLCTATDKTQQGKHNTYMPSPEKTRTATHPSRALAPAVAKFSFTRGNL